MNVEARLGDVVLWFPGADKHQTPHVGVVTAIGLDAVDLNVLAPNFTVTLPKEGVRHVEDPLSKKPELMESGGWMHRDDWYAGRKKADRPAEPVTAK